MDENEIVDKEYDWLVKNEDGSFTIKTKEGDYKLQEVTDDVVESCTRISEKSKVSIAKLIATRTIVEPKVSDRDFGALKSSVSSKLKFAAMKINGLTDFL